MKIHDLTQGSPAWHALRARCHNASELAAVRGRSKYQKRSELVRQKATGIIPEVTPEQQRRFDAGHETEALARAIVEAMIGEVLYPTVATDDDEYLLASSDGSTMLGDVGYEHKLWNEDLAAAVRISRESGVCQLDPHYTDQMDQQIAVYGFERIIFVTSDGTKDKFESMEYTGNPESIARIRADWAQFDADVAAYEPEVIEAKPILSANPIDHLPALVIEVTGRVTHSNLTEFKAAATAVISSIKTDLVSDQDFVDATAAVKYLKDVEDNAKRAKQNALDQTESIAALHRALDEVIGMAAAVRKSLDKKITEEKDKRKEEIIIDARADLADHVSALNNRIGGMMPAFSANFAEAVKSLRSLDSMRDKVSGVLANAKVESSAIADRIEANIKSLEANGENWRFLFPDLAAVCAKASDDFAALLSSRVAAHKAAEEKRLEAERERIRAEEQARAQRLAAEEAAKAQREAAAEAARNAEKVQEIAPSVMDKIGEAESAGAISPSTAAGLRETVSSIAADAVISKARDCVTTIKLGEICSRLGFTVTADFLAGLGIHPVATEKNAKLYDANKFPTICRLISEHVMSLAFEFKQAA